MLPTTIARNHAHKTFLAASEWGARDSIGITRRVEWPCTREYGDGDLLGAIQTAALCGQHAGYIGHKHGGRVQG